MIKRHFLIRTSLIYLRCIESVFTDGDLLMILGVLYLVSWNSLRPTGRPDHEVDVCHHLIVEHD